MKRIITACRLTTAIVFSAAFAVLSQSIDITGTVVDTATSQPIANALVRLVDIPAITATTNASGQFALTGTSSRAIHGTGSTPMPFEISLSGATLTLAGTDLSATLVVEIFDACGVCVVRAATTARPGETFVFPSPGQSPAVYLVKIRVRENEQFVKCLVLPNRGISVRTSTASAESSAPLARRTATHTVEASKLGYVAKRISAASETGDVGVIKLRSLPVSALKEIPAGTFTMGEMGVGELVHQVTLSAFAIQETEVTQAQYLAVMGANPASFAGTPARPVERVSWFNAAQYCNALSRLSGLDEVYDTTTWAADVAKNGFRLPTEAQWEYACRGGQATSFWWGPDTAGMGARTWSTYNSGATTHPVASKLPNGYGLYDMTGNVWEWCGDWYEDYYAAVPVTNPIGPSTGSYRALRGGSYYDSDIRLHSASRNAVVPGRVNLDIGFRCVLPR